MWRMTPYDDEAEEKRIEIEIHNAYERGFKAGLQAKAEKTCDTCKHYNEFCETPMIKGCKLYEQGQVDGNNIKAQAELNAYVIKSALDNDTNTVIATGGTQADGDLTTALCSLPKIQSSDGQDYVQLYDVLETLRCSQTDGDLINRQDAIDAMTLSNINQNMDDLDDDIGRKVKRSVQRILAQLPTVATLAEPKMVEYTGDGYADGKMVYDMANCPNCDYEFEESDFIWGCKFCPECGQALKWKGEEE